MLRAAFSNCLNPSIGRRRDLMFAVILLNDVVEILARAGRDGSQLSILGQKLTDGPMGSLVSVEGDRARHTSLWLRPC
jgi:hypothetical protein